MARVQIGISVDKDTRDKFKWLCDFRRERPYEVFQALIDSAYDSYHDNKQLKALMELLGEFQDKLGKMNIEGYDD